MKSSRYWERRAEQRMESYLKAVEKEAAALSRSYRKSSEYLTGEAENVLKNFALSNHLSEAEAKRLLRDLPDDTTRRTLKKLLNTISDPEAKEELKAVIESPAYAWRIQRLEALQEDINVQMQALYNVAATKTTSLLQSTAKDAYLKTMFDIQKGVGYGFSFSRMPVSRVNEILRQPRNGAHYSKRLWSNTEKLAGKLKEELLTGFLSGRSYQKTTAALMERMASGSMETKRLVYTEANYVANQAELDSYRECGVEKYRFCATLDGKTSAICRNLDGKEFPGTDAMPGRNFPPMHPWCRSTTVAVLEEMETANLKRRAKDPETGKYHLIPYDMTYEEWKKSLAKQNPSDMIEGGRIFKGEKGICGKKKETAILYDKQGKELMRKTGSEARVRFTKEEIKRFKGSYFTHTHPADITLSVTDIYRMRQYGLAEVRAVTDQGIYVARPPKEWKRAFGTLKEFQQSYLEMGGSIIDEIQQKIDKGLIEKAQAETECQHVLMKQLSQSYGFEYELISWEDKK